jgi:hypothetical protein
METLLWTIWNRKESAELPLELRRLPLIGLATK